MQGRNLTPQELAKFIQKLKLTGGNVSRACQAIKISRAAAYEHKKNNPDFSALWEEAIEAGVDDLEQEARRRAFKGTKKPVYQKGGLVGYIQEYSDSLMMFLLKGKRPEIYRERMDINQNIQGTLDVNIEHEIEMVYGDDLPDGSEIISNDSESEN